ncbi:MAG: hypothetical protein ACPK85_04305 [Methanosarcina sp.]
MTEEILIHGKVQGYDQKPIFMIQVSAWVEENNAFRQVDRTYTDEAGIYRLPVPKKGLVSIRFDTHWSLTNVNEWHPSVVSNIDTIIATDIDTNIGPGQDIVDIVLNRYLMKVGTSSGPTAEIDALTAYQFCAAWNARGIDRETARKYSESAVSRLSQMKISMRELDEFRVKLLEFFSKQAEQS